MASTSILSKLATLYCLGDPNLGARLRSLHIRKALRGLRWLSLADIGCARGGVLGWGGGIATNAFLIAKYHPSSRVLGADLDETTIEQNAILTQRDGIGNLSFVQFDLLAPTEIDLQDVVTMVDVLGNAPNDEALIRGACRVVRPGGHLIIHTIVHRMVPADHSGVAAADYTRSELSRILNSAGATQVRFSCTFGLFGEIAWRINDASRMLGAHFVVFTFPACLVLAGLDLVAKNTTGKGIVAIAKIED